MKSNSKYCKQVTSLAIYSTFQAIIYVRILCNLESRCGEYSLIHEQFYLMMQSKEGQDSGADLGNFLGGGGNFS